MAEMDHVGSACQLPGCNQHDFLPFVCPLCGLVLCLQHRGVTAHECASPASKILSDSSAEGDKIDGSSGFACFLCKDPLPCRIECGFCCNSVCLTHRDIDAHACSGAAAARSPSIAAAAGGAGASPAGNLIAPMPGRSSVPAVSSAGRPPDDKALALARKVALTKLKMRCPPPPKGIAAEDLLYFETRCASLSPYAVVGSSGGASKPMCVSRLSTVAQLLDAVAAAHGVINNNASELDPAKRLHLRSAPPVTGPAAAAAAVAAVPPAEDALQPVDARLRDCIRLSSGDVLVLCRGGTAV